MKKLICKKLRSKAGETIAEVLIALLITSFAMIVLAQMISTASNMLKTSETTMKEYYSNNNKLAEQVDGGTTGTLSMAFGGKTYDTTQVDLFKNDRIGGIDVIAYKIHEGTP